jgi:PAS domain S-box-containing protein
MIGSDALCVVFEASPLGISVLAGDGRLSCANASLERMLGYSEAELQNHTLAELTHPGDAAGDVALFEELVAGTRDTYQLHKRFLRKDGAALWSRQTISRHVGSDDREVVVAMIEDISAAQATEERLRGLVHTLGERIKELTALHRAAQLLTQTRDTREQQLRAMAALLPPAMQYPTIATASIRYGHETYATAGHATTDWTIGASFQTAIGHEGHVEVAYHDARPEEAQGPFLLEEVTLLSSLAEMIRAAIDRQDTESALQETNTHFNLALTAAGMGIWEWDIVHNTTRWSAQLSHMLGLAGELTARYATHAGLIHADDRERVFQRLNLAADGHDDLRNLSFRMRRRDGEWRVMEASTLILREPPARATRIIAALVDVSDRHLLQEHLRQSEKR